MFKVLNHDRLDEVLSYLRAKIYDCLYLYGDIVVYGLDDPNISVWFDEDDTGINCVIMKYFNGAHIYSKDYNCNYDNVVELFNEIDPYRISGQGNVIRILLPMFKGKYRAEYGRTLQLSEYRRFKPDINIQTATLEDVDDIVELLMQNELYSETYLPEQLKAELVDRIGRGIGRSFIIRDGNRVIGHDSYNLETDEYTIAGLALIHDDFRKTFYGIFLESHTINSSIDEGKAMYAMLFDPKRVENYVKMGNTDVGEYGKLVLDV